MRPGHYTNAGQVDTDNMITATSTNTQQQLTYIINIILLIETKLMYDVVDYSTSIFYKLLTHVTESPLSQADRVLTVKCPQISRASCPLAARGSLKKEIVSFSCMMCKIVFIQLTLPSSSAKNKKCCQLSRDSFSG